MHRFLKQCLYFLLFAAFCGGLIYLVYRSLFAVPPSCFDTKQNQGEEGIDCGGPCKTFCLATNQVTPSPLSAPRVFQPSTDLVAVLVELKNPNTTSAARIVPYEIIVQGDGGTPLQLKGVVSLYATEVRRLVLVRPIGSLTGTLRADITIASSSVQWAPSLQFQKPLLQVVSAVTTSTPSGIQVQGAISSDDALAVTDVTALALFYDRDGVLQGASQTVIPRLEAGATTPFSIAYPPLATIDPNATQVSVSAYRP